MPDAALSLPQKQLLLDMLHNALLEIRRLGRQGHAEQAADLADAFHNLPALLLNDHLRLPLLRTFLAEYQQKYASQGGLLYDYLALLDEVEQQRTV